MRSIAEYIVDPLYGPMQLDPIVCRLAATPEVQRLRDVRLININSPNLTALGEVSRYGHSLAVTYLADLLTQSQRQFTPEERGLLLTAAILHDIGTPAFGHSVEYILRDLYGWQHEEVVEDIILGRYRPENKYHQIYFGNELGVYDALCELSETVPGLSLHRIINMILGKETTGSLLNGTIDLDNIDNVFRMYFYLGFGNQAATACQLAQRLWLRGTEVVLDQAAIGLGIRWAEARERCYKVLLLNPENLAAVSMLNEALEITFYAQALMPEDWFLTDHQILLRLHEFKPTRPIIQRLMSSDLYQVIGIYWLNYDEKICQNLRNRSARLLIEEALSEQCQFPVRLHLSVDNGTFRKPIPVLRDTQHTQVIVEPSLSLVIGMFTPNRTDMISSQRRQAKQRLFATLSRQGRVAERFIGGWESEYEIGPQRALSYGV